VAVPDRPLRPLLALCCAAVLLAGCGGAVGSEKGSVSVSVTRDFGAEPVVSSPPVGIEGTTPLADVLDRVTDSLEGSRAITSVDGVDGAWRLWINGVRVANAQKAKVRSGDRVWLDLPGAGVTASVPAVTGSFPEPFVHGVGGKRIPIRVECTDPKSAACNAAVKKLSDLGLVAARGGINAGVNDLTIRVLVGPWSELRATRDTAVLRVDQGPSSSGIFARFGAGGHTLDVLDGHGRSAQALGGDTGLVAATKVDDHEPVWFVTGTDEAGVEAAAGALDEATLTTDYALAVHDDRGVAVPAR
jgi:hypothetical protein